MRSIGSFGVEYAAAEEQGFAYFGTEVRINPDFGELDLADFMEAANSLDENSVESLSLLKDTMRAAVHAEDFDSFWSTAKRNRQGIADLMPILYAVVEAVSDRPTERPSDSSDGPQRTKLSSVDGSSSQVIARLEGQHRPDLANMVELASRASAASA